MKTKTKLGLASFLVAATGFIAYSGGDESPPPTDNPKSFSLLPLSEHTGKPSSAPNPVRNTSSPLSISLQTAATSAKQKEYGSDAECIGSLYYKRYVHSLGTPDDKFSNLRWATEVFPGKDMSETLDNAAKGLGIDRSKLISDLKAAAINVFKLTQTSHYTSNTDWFNHWDNLRIAHKYAGLETTGDFNTALSVATVSYNEASLVQNRDAYVLSVATDMVTDTKGTISALKQAYEENLKKGSRRNESLSDALSTLTPDKRIKLREKIDFILYVTETFLAQDSQSNVRIGLDVDSYDLLVTINASGILNTKIFDDLNNACKQENNMAHTPR